MKPVTHCTLEHHSAACLFVYLAYQCKLVIKSRLVHWIPQVFVPYLVPCLFEIYEGMVYLQLVFAGFLTEYMNVGGVGWISHWVHECWKFVQSPFCLLRNQLVLWQWLLLLLPVDDCGGPFNITLLAWLINLMVLWLSHCHRSPSFGNVIISDDVHRVGPWFDCQMLMQILVSTSMAASPPHMMNFGWFVINTNYRYISHFLQVGCSTVTVETLPYYKIWGWDVNHINIGCIQRYIHHHIVILITWGRWKYLDIALQTGANLSVWKGCQMGTMLAALSGQIIIIVDPSV